MDEAHGVTTCVGIDVSKVRLDVHLRPSGEAFAVSRDGKGLENLAERLAALEVSLIVLQATGGFEVTLAAALAGAGLPLAVVNPRQIRTSPARSESSPRPTPSTPEVIALFAERVRPEPAACRRQARRPRRTRRRRRQFVEMIGMESNRRRQAADTRLAKKIERHLAFLEKELAAIDADIDAGCAPRPLARG